MRIGGRESLEIAPGVTLHADHREQAPAGVVVFTGRVYLDGSGQGMDSRWPRHAYAGKAEWHREDGGVLILSGGVSAERGQAVWQGKGAESTMQLDGKRIHTHGPMKTFLTLGTHGEKAGTPRVSGFSSGMGCFLVEIWRSRSLNSILPGNVGNKPALMISIPALLPTCRIS
jgi:hypothetical protein